MSALPTGDSLTVIVRLPAYLAIETALLASLAGVALWGGLRASERYGFSFGIATSSAATVGSIPERRAPLEPGPVDVARSSVGSFMGIDDELLLERMRHADVARAKHNRGGSSISFRLDFADGSRAAFKPEQTNPQTVPRKEIAAYRLNRILGMNNVPPATARTVHRDDLVGKLAEDQHWMTKRIDAETIFDAEGFTRGEVSYWIPVIVDSHLDQPEKAEEWTRWLTVDEPLPQAKAAILSQLTSLLLFDLLTNNSDRFSGGNLLQSTDGKILFWMDNTFGFQLDPTGHSRCWTWLRKSQKFSRQMVSRLRALTITDLRLSLRGESNILSEAEMNAILHRRDAALQYVDGLIAQHDEEKVLAFP